MQANPITGNNILRELRRLLGVYGNVELTVKVGENCFVLTWFLPGRQQLRIVIQFTRVISIDLTQLHNLQNFMIELFLFNEFTDNIKFVECYGHKCRKYPDDNTNEFCTSCHDNIINLGPYESQYFVGAIDLQDIIDEIEDIEGIGEMYIDSFFYITVSIEPIPESELDKLNVELHELKEQIMLWEEEEEEEEEYNALCFRANKIERIISE